MINPFSAFKNWLEEELLDVEAMLLAIKQIYGLLEKEEQLKDKLNTLEEDIKKGQSGQVSFIKGLFKKKKISLLKLKKKKKSLNKR